MPLNCTILVIPHFICCPIILHNGTQSTDHCFTVLHNGQLNHMCDGPLFHISMHLLTILLPCVSLLWSLFPHVYLLWVCTIAFTTFIIHVQYSHGLWQILLSSSFHFSSFHHQLLKMSQNIYGDSNFVRYLPKLKGTKSDPLIQAITMTKTTNAVLLRDALCNPKTAIPWSLCQLSLICWLPSFSKIMISWLIIARPSSMMSSWGYRRAVTTSMIMPLRYPNLFCTFNMQVFIIFFTRFNFFSLSLSSLTSL